MPPPSSDEARWFAEEVRPHEGSLLAYLRAAAPAAVEAKDLLQDSYLRLLRMRARGEIRSVRALLFAIARNAVSDAVRRKLSNREISGTELADLPVLDQADVVETVTRRQEQDLLADAIQELPTRCRDVLLLRKIHGFSQREIAARLGISENTVESLVSRGMRRCGRYMRRRLDADRR
jgi:RNA polymerase sigma-70 factor (ECF subfamily)